ncbi:acyl carrier protein [Streptomyces fulvorobeus]|uniref:Acyl carrier protein n=1 Tax=Streptomyces fulvorobeus TaxID=284028 RepID=A0A7J0C0V0_9ACTN|nr:acyl carrier protein [Streptomyces fulvorobeus]NYE39830.1 acyl carrier protein [Streptomyces fulvorobeus]GFM96081.1 acyl carrier protein [Streptomyces fulvorobeus]
MSSTYDRLVGLLAKSFGIEPDEVAPEDTFESLELDSLALVELTLVAQEEFGISLTDDDLHAKSSLTEAAGVLDAKQVTV